MLMLLAACSTAPEPPQATTGPANSQTSAPTSPQPRVYPGPAGTPAPYPAATKPPIVSSGYPPPTVSPVQGPAFQITTPVRAADTKITGTGPAGIEVRVVDLTQSGVLLGTTKIKSDGTFEATLTAPLMPGNRVALMLGLAEDRSKFLSGPGYQDYPLIGIVFATAPVE